MYCPLRLRRRTLASRLLIAVAFVAATPLATGQCFAAEPAAAALTVRPGDLIRQAAARGDRRVVVPPGTYRLADGIELANLRDLEIVGDGVTLVFTRLSRAINLSRCADVTLRGFTVDYDPLPFTQGKVVEVSADRGSVDVRLDAGYPRVAYSRVDVCDPKTRTRKRGMPFLWGAQAKLVGGDVVRLSRKDLGATAVVGDLISLSGGPGPGGAPHAVALDHCRGTTFRDVTVHTAPGMGILEADGEGDKPTQYLNVRVVPGAPPAGATEARLLSTTWDALQCKSTRVGPTLDGCEVRDAGDDSWSVQSGDFVVLAARGQDAVIGFRDEYCDGPRAGEHLRAPAGGPAAAIVGRRRVELANADLAPEVADKVKRAGAWDYWHVGRRVMRVTLDREVPFAVGQSVYCPDRQCDGFVVRRCTFHSPGRGALVKGSNGLIEHNLFVDCHSAVTVNAELPDRAASGIGHLVIRNNRVSGTGYFCPMYESSQAGSISVVGKPQRIGDLTIEGNVFDDVNGVSVCLVGVDGARVADNRFTTLHATRPQNTGGRIGVDQRCAVFAAGCTDVRLEGNTADRLGPFTASLVAGDAFPAGREPVPGLVVTDAP